MTRTGQGALAIAVAAVTWGTWRLWLPGPALDPSAQGAFVLTVAGLVATLASRPWRRPHASRWWAWMALFGVTEAANFLLYFRGLAAGDGAAAAVTHYLAPLLVALFSPLVGALPSKRVKRALPIAFVGTVVLAGFGAVRPGTAAAATFGAGSALFFAANVLLAKHLSREFGALEILGVHNLLAAPLVWAFSTTPPWTAGPTELLLATGGGLVGGLFASALYFHGIARVPATRAAVLAYLEPLSTAVVGAVVLGESLGPVRAIALLVVLGAGAYVAGEGEPPDAAASGERDA